MKKSIKFSSGADFVDKMQKKSKKLDDKLNDNIYVDLSASEIKEEQILDIMNRYVRSHPDFYNGTSVVNILVGNDH